MPISTGQSPLTRCGLLPQRAALRLLPLDGLPQPLNGLDATQHPGVDFERRHGGDSGFERGAERPAVRLGIPAVYQRRPKLAPVESYLPRNVDEHVHPADVASLLEVCRKNRLVVLTAQTMLLGKLKAVMRQVRVRIRMNV